MTELQVSLLHAVTSAESIQEGESSETRLNLWTAQSWNCQQGEKLLLRKGHTWPTSNT